MKDLLDLKVKYCREVEKRERKEYLKERDILKEVYQRLGKERKFRKVLVRVSKRSKEAWQKGVRKVESKIKWSVQKLSVLCFLLI